MPVRSVPRTLLALLSLTSAIFGLLRIAQPSLIPEKGLLKIDKSFAVDCLTIETASA